MNAILPASDAHELRHTSRARVHVSVYNHRLHVELRWLDGVLDGNNAVLAVLQAGVVQSADYVLWDFAQQYVAEIDKPAAEIAAELLALDHRLILARVNAA